MAWKKGQSGNMKGRPPKDKEQKFYQATLSSCTVKDWQAIIKQAVADAKKGDTAARSFLAKYLMPEGEDLNVKHTGWVEVAVDFSGRGGKVYAGV